MRRRCCPRARATNRGMDGKAQGHGGGWGKSVRERTYVLQKPEDQVDGLRHHFLQAARHGGWGRRVGGTRSCVAVEAVVAGIILMVFSELRGTSSCWCSLPPVPAPTSPP